MKSRTNKLEQIYKKKLKRELNKNSVYNLIELNQKGEIGVRIDIWTHLMRGCIINYVH